MSSLASVKIFGFLVVVLAVGQATEANQLGRPFSILHGLKPALPVQGDFSSVFYPVKKAKLFENIQHETVQSENPHFSDFIQLTYHPDEKDLIKTFFSIWHFEDETRDAGPFTYQPSSGDTPTRTKETYASLLGISPDNMVGKSYVLARYWKKLNTTTVTSADFSDLTTSAFSSNSSSNQISRLFAEYGTHYVSGYEMGDMIYQVFVYNKEKAKSILRHFDFDNPISSFGPRGFSFRLFTQKLNEENRGYCREVGRILSASGDPALDNIRPKLDDNVYNNNESIFMFAATPNAFKMMDNLTKVMPLKIVLKPIVSKLETEPDSPTRQKWNNVLAATIYQKFGPASSPNFPEVPDTRVRDVYDSFNPDLVTSTATNYVTITRMTFRLDDFYVLDPEYVTHLFIFADVLEISPTAKLSLPGSQKIYLVCRKFVALSSGNNVPEIIVGSHGKSDPVLKIIAEEFRGILKVRQANEGTHHTYANQLVYKSVRDPDLQDMYTVKTDNNKRLSYPNRQTVPELYDAADKSHEGKWLRGSLINSFELAVASVETILAAHTSNDAFNTARESLEWITEILVKSADNSTHLSTDLEMVLGRALLIRQTQLAQYAKSRVIVPKLSFPEYKTLYQSLLTAVASYEDKYKEVTREINRRRQMEAITNSLQELNGNVKRIGSFLVEQAEVNAQYQDDVAKNQQELHDLEKDRIDREQAKADALLVEIQQTHVEMDKAGKDLNAALENYQNEQIVSAVFTVVQVVGSLFAGGVGLANIGKEFQGIVRVAEKVKNVMTIIEQVEKLYDLGINMRNDIGTINRVLENMPNIQIDVDTFPTELEWDDFDTNVGSYLSTESFLPEAVAGEALEYQRAAKRLSSRGRKYISVAAKIADIQYKQIQIELERDLSNRHSDRLRELKTTLTQDDLSDNDAKTTDLFELGHIIKMKENQVRSQLVQAFVVMDAALQYYYLQEATLIERFDTMTIQQAAVNQIQSSISALENFPSLPKDLKKPIKYDIEGVCVKALLSKDGYKVTIPLSSLPFHEYVRVRVLRMEVRADNISRSADNTAYIQATASGELFQDRDLNRNPRNYSTFPTEFRTVYDIDSGETIGNPSEEFSRRFIKITPFDNWVFRIPNVTTNKGIKFKRATTTLRIKFYLRAIFNPARLNSDDQHGKLADDVRGSKEELLRKLDGRSLVNDWDAIMAVNAERVNEIWKKQYDDETNEGFVKRIVTNKTVSHEVSMYRQEVRLTMEVGPPKIQFVRNNQNRATLKIQIKSAFLETWDTYIKIDEVHAGNETLEVTDDSSISGTMNLKKIRGSLEGTPDNSRIVLDLSDEVFDFIGMDITNDYVNVALVHQINKFFNTKLKSKDYEVARITYESRLTPASLVPDSFRLATGGFGTENSYGTLYVFFKTRSPDSMVRENTPADFNDPLSIEQQIIPTGYEAALFINNRIIFKDIIAKDIADKFGFEVQTKVLEKQATSSSQQSLYVVGSPGAKYTLDIWIDFDRSNKDTTVHFTIPGHTLQAKPINKGRKIQVHWVNNNLDFSVPYPYTSPFCFKMSCAETLEHETSSFSTSYIKTFTPTIDRHLTIKYTMDGSSSASSGSLSWFSRAKLGTDYEFAKDTITSSANTYMSGLSFNFKSISAFAITQVLFPNRNVFHMTEVYVPGDMLILGTLVTK